MSIIDCDRLNGLIGEQAEEIARLTKENARLWAALDRIACGYWNETACHSIAREALKAIRGKE